MRRPLLAIVTILVAAAAGAADHSRTLTLEKPADGLTGIVVKAGIGDVEIVAQDSPTISVEVEVSAKRTSFFGSRADVEAAEIAVERTGSTLHLEVTTPHHEDHGYTERWSIRMPAALAARLKLGVGDIRVLDTTGDLDVEVGVGDIRVESAYDAFGPIRASAGVGDVKLRTPSGRETGDGFISKSLDSRGGGKAGINAHAGVGDVDLRLR